MFNIYTILIECNVHFLKEKNVTVYCCCTYASHCILGKLHKVLYTLSVKNTATTKKSFLIFLFEIAESIFFLQRK